MAFDPKDHELQIPPTVYDDENSGEMLRAWVAHNGLHVSLAPLALGDDPSVWGVLLVDVARHVARAFEQEKQMSPDDALALIKKMFDAEWNTPTDWGTTGKVPAPEKGH